MGCCVSISHKAHDERCLKCLKTKGLSAMTVFVGKHAKKMAAFNTMPLSKGRTKGLPCVLHHFETTMTTTTNSTGTTTKTTNSDSATATTSASSNKGDKDNQQRRQRQRQ
jgi:hypothetical protein